MKATKQWTVVGISVVALAACGSPESAWEKASTADTVEAYEKYVRKYPDGQNLDEAIARIDFLNKTEIHRAVQAGDKDQIETLLSTGTNVNTTEGARITPLHVAASECRTDIAGLLIGKGASATMEAKDWSTSLHHAARSGCVDTMNLLLSKGAVLDAEVKVGLAGFVMRDGEAVSFGGQSKTTKGTPLHWAAEAGQTEAAALLIEKGAEVDFVNGWGEAPLHLAAESGSVPTVELLLGNGGVAQYGDEIDKRYPKKSGQPIHRASSIPVVEALVEAGATIDAQSPNNGMPIHTAASHNYAELVEYYLGKGIDPNVLARWNTGSGRSSEVPPLWTASAFGHLNIVQLLESKGGDLSFSTTGWKEGGSLLHAAAMSGNPELIDYLLDKGLEINGTANISTGQALFQPFRQMTPLATAAYYGRRGAVERLVERGADIKQTVNGGWKVTEMAIKSNDPVLVRYLLDHGAEIDATVDSIDRWRISDEMKAEIKDFLSTAEPAMAQTE